MKITNTKRVIYTPLILAIVLVAGIFIGNQLKKDTTSNRFLIYPRTDKLSNVLNYIEEEYVDSVNRDVLVESAIPEMLKQLDPHSVYIPAKDLQRVNEPLEGNFSGIGVEFNMPEDTVVIINTIPNGPSELVGILPGDRIVEVDDTIIAGVNMSTSSIVRKLKGPQGTKVEVTIARPGEKEPMKFEITRDEIPLYSIDVAYMITDQIGYVKINQFSRTTYEEFLAAVKKLKDDNMEKILIDLRGNGGGYLDAATKIVDQFLEKGKLIVYTEGQSKPRQNIFATVEGGLEDMDVMVIIDEWSASASEILAGAIQDNDRGIIVGRRSFGKGLVQEQTLFADGSAMRLTIARYYTPTGRSIQKPYEEGFEDYYNDLHQRYEHGEFIEVDSIKFADSLKFNTPDGDIVYGGGGIMPDYFIPADTTGTSKYLTRLRSKNLVYKFAFNYADKNRNTFVDYANYSELVNYLKNQNLLAQFVKYAEENGVKKDPGGLKTSGEIIETQIKAYIVRHFFNSEGYYPVIKEIDKTLNKAIEIFTVKEE